MQPSSPPLSEVDRLESQATSLRHVAECIRLHEAKIKDVKNLRVHLDCSLQNMKQLPLTDELHTASVRLKESIMWLGMELKRLGEDNPYPNSYDPENAKIDPTAQGLKL
jgi:hypothetical protein